MRSVFRGRRKHYLLSFVIQIIVAGLFLHPWDGFVLLTSVQDFLHGITPYETGALGRPYINALNMECWYAYPPLPLLLLTSTFAPYYYLFPGNLVLERIFLKLSIVLGNLICAYLVYRIVSEVGNTRKASKAEKMILYNPFLIFIGAAWGMFDVWIVVFLLLCILRLRQGQAAKAGVYLALSVLVKPIAVVFAPVLLVYLWNKSGGIAKPAVLASLAVITGVVFCLPFIIVSPGGFYDQVIGIHAERPPGGCAPLFVLYVGKMFEEMRSFHFPYLPTSTVSAISAALLFLTLALLSLHLRFKREVGERGLLAALFVAMLFFSLFSKLVNPQYFVVIVVLAALVVYAYDGCGLIKHSLVKKYYLAFVLVFLVSQILEGRHFLLFLPPDIATGLFGKTGGQLDLQLAQNSFASPNFYYLAVQFSFIALLIPVFALGTALAVPAIKELVRSVSAGLVDWMPQKSWLMEHRETVRKTIALLIATSLIVVPASAGAWAYEDPEEELASPPDDLGAKSVGVFYYYWWNNSARNPYRINDNWTAAGLTPKDGFYDVNTEYMREDIRQMKAAGIDFAVVSVPNYQVEVERYVGFATASEKEGFRFAPMVEVHELDLDRPAVGAQPYVPSEEMKEEVIGKLHTALDQRDSTSFLRLDGKPVVFVHNNPYFPAGAQYTRAPDFWSEIRAKVEAEYGEVFLATDLAPAQSLDEIAPFDAGFYLPQLSWQDAESDEQALANWSARMAEIGTSGLKYRMATVLPYYHDLKTNPYGQEIPENLGDRSTYGAFWGIAIESQSNMALIFAWNEYFESACLEPTEEFGDRFLQVTRPWTEEFKTT